MIDSEIKALALAACLIASGCNSTNPVEPGPAENNPQPGAGAYLVSVTANPSSLVVGSTTPGEVTVTVRRASDNQPASGVSCAVSTNLGSFAADRALQLQTTQVNNGTATLKLYPGTDKGTANLLAQVETSYGRTSIPIQDEVVPVFYLSSIEPGSGTVEGGTPAVIQGGGFRGQVRVTFGGVVATDARLAGSPGADGSYTTITATVPRSPTVVEVGTTLNVNVTVTNAIDQPEPISDTLPGGYTYTNGTALERPVVFSVTPAIGPNEGNQRVTIRGDFLPATPAEAEVLFGLRAVGGGLDGLAASVVSASRTSLVVITPAATGLGTSLLNKQVDVQVRNRSTGFSTIAIGAYRYAGDELAISGISARSGSANGGDTVEITGRGFRSPVEVQFGGATQEVVSVTEGRIVVRTVAVSVANCSAPSGPVTVTNVGRGQSATSALTFTYTVDKPFLSTVSPVEGDQAGGTPVTLSGRLFGSRDFVRVEFNGVPSQELVSVSSEQVVAKTPPYTGTFETESCTAPDGTAGVRNKAKAVDVRVSNLQTGCADSLALAFRYKPADTLCRTTTPPTADFDYDIGPGRTVRFFNRSTGSKVTKFEWAFGDNGRASAENPTHTYAVDGIYTVTLTVSNSVGSDSVSKQIQVPLPPVSPPR